MNPTTPREATAPGPVDNPPADVVAVMDGDVYDDEAGPTRCVVLTGVAPFADELAAVVGLSVHAASEIVDTHLERGEN